MDSIYTEKYGAGVGCMKRKRWLRYILAVSLVLSSCQAVNPGMDGQKTDGGYGTGDEIGHGSGNESGNETGNAPGHEPGQSPQPGGMESAPGQNLAAGQDPVVISEAARNLGADNGILTGTFFQAGDIRRRLTLRPAKGGMESEWLECGFSVQDENHADAFSGTGSAGILTEKGKVSYEIRPQAYGSDEGKGSEAPVYTVTFHVAPDLSDRHISVEGSGALAGDYYPMEGSFLFPDVFVRYLSKADLCMWPTEDLSLLRNEIYAAHGRIFKSDILNSYYSGKLWYRGIIQPDVFSESVLSDVEKKNIAFIKEMEADPDRNCLDGQTKCGLEDLPFAPYLPLLGAHGETGLYADLSTARDMGAYYIVQGSISIPASITARQREFLDDGGEVLVVLNELTGEYRTLAPDPGAEGQETAYGYLLYEEDGYPDGRGCETGLSLNHGTGNYELWQTSADTVMKTIYEGDIYILKGAVQGAYTSISMASRDQKEILPADGEQAMDRTWDVLAGNCLCYNSRGHFTAVYSLGD